MEKRSKSLMLWEAVGCSKQLGDDDQTQTAQSTLDYQIGEHNYSTGVWSV